MPALSSNDNASVHKAMKLACTCRECDPGGGLRFTHPVERPEPVANYLKLIGKYRHLSDAEIAHIQRTVDDKIAFLRKLAEMVPAQGPVSPN